MIILVKNIVTSQKKYFSSEVTRDYNFRMESLNKLKNSILKYEDEINNSIKLDLNKSKAETYITEIGIILDEISFHQKHLKKWMKEKSVKTSMAQMPGKCFITPEPYGTVLIISPWNYPIHLCLLPLVGSISSGNTSIIKPSEYTPHTSDIISKIISDVFPEEYISVVQGGVSETTLLLEEKFDYIFFTGSSNVGKIVMSAASKHLTPVTLELGGKSPVIVDESANIKLSAKRIAFGKVINAGQTCVAPDYLLIHKSIKEEFITEFKNALNSFFMDKDMSSMVNIINETHYNRLKNLMRGEHIILGGTFDDDRKFIEPTLIDEVTFSSPIMKDEIFGPILPIISYSNLSECIEYIANFEKPLALYIFSENKENIAKIIGRCAFGGGCINDTIIHLSNPNLPFGGVGNSGIGSYHGKKSFDTFTHYKSIFKQSNIFDVPFRYMPYTDKKLSIIKKILK